MLKTKEEKILSLATSAEGDKVVKIDFTYNLETLMEIRKLPGRKHHSEQTCWSAPLYRETIDKLLSLGFIMDDKLTAYLQNDSARLATGVKIKGLHGKLYPFQHLGVMFIDHNKGRALVADEMGLGKTIQALAWLQLHPDIRPVIIVCPASIKLKWKREAESWMKKPKVEVLSGEKPWTPKGDILIINYDVIHKWTGVLSKLYPQAMVTDECHLYKNNRAKRTKAIKRLAKVCPYFIAMSGTPIVNRPAEIYNAVNIIMPGLFPKFWEFARRYCGMKHNGFGWDYSGATNMPELHHILTSTVMIRRLKKDVLKELPDKIPSFVPIELDNKTDYDFAEKDFIKFVRQFKSLEEARKAAKAKTFALKQIAVQGKLAGAIRWIEDFLENDTKLVVFAHHRFVVSALMDKFEKVAVKIDGTVPQNKRLEVQDAFQKDPKVRLFIGNHKAAGVGLDLTSASNVAILELPWTPGDLSQSIDRCHRIGQKDVVNVHYLLAEDTIEERLALILDKKRKILDGVLDGKNANEEPLLTELIKSYLE